jgi:predicted Zn-dependent protease
MVYEVCDGLPEAVVQSKMQSKAAFEKALHLYSSKKFAEAKVAFEKLIGENPRDSVLHLYNASCDALMHKGSVSDSWFGELSLTKEGTLETRLIITENGNENL